VYEEWKPFEGYLCTLQFLIISKYYDNARTVKKLKQII
jgi:hypothetical protein